MILLTNGDSWTQGDSPAQTPNWKAKKTLDWYDIVPNFGNLYKYVDQDGTPIVTNNTRILYKFYDSPVWPKKLGELIVDLEMIIILLHRVLCNRANG